ncbi:Rab guanine nucleotide exchange factor sec2 [Neolecta irregularis DAH-3]|uniref:Rab guanine nucleotide exchange factor sec2 n=1 Tax=Neolecta irregularis (strain DAH-3) TaxID=1198029 RepID=A0A1U7LJ30_NEOID|nr:Rab guanine nucleotide exchange factor sec2 [Neolecta irregularis DAH-3]|eukprot:OLL22657.1 Rab guanine nucleotide exchange factor sec2 [Neolecta irregularis DAH-3]
MPFPSESTTGDGDFENSDLATLHNEVSVLSRKLIESVNRNADLEDATTVARRDLKIAQQRIEDLEAQQKLHLDRMEKGLLVDKSEVQTQTEQLMRRLMEERAQRGQAEKDKRTIEQEIEDLTLSLFEEANAMVAAARNERDDMARKNEQLQARVRETDTLLASLQGQLTALKAVIQGMKNEEAEVLSSSNASTPRLRYRASRESLSRLVIDPSNPYNPAPIPDSPGFFQPTNGPAMQFLQSILRSDIQPYRDFAEFCQTSRSFSLQQPVAISTPTSPRPHFLIQRVSPLVSPSLPPPPSSPSQVAFRDTRWVKRCLLEDIEPTLRLDVAPGLSWLVRRNTLTAILDNTLVIDPIPASKLNRSHACALCGEQHHDQQQQSGRSHVFRTSGNPLANRYLLCSYCVRRVRSVCDFIGFLRAIREGLFRADDDGSEFKAWEEATKMREACFWARIGGGVVPPFQFESGSRKHSLEIVVEKETELKNQVKVRRDWSLEEEPLTPVMAQDTNAMIETLSTTSPSTLSPELDEINGDIGTEFLAPNIIPGLLIKSPIAHDDSGEPYDGRDDKQDHNLNKQDDKKDVSQEGSEKDRT